MKVGIIGCGAIANIITTSIVPENNGIEIAYFFDKDIERAENLASFAGGVAALDFDELVDGRHEISEREQKTFFKAFDDANIDVEKIKCEFYNSY